MSAAPPQSPASSSTGKYPSHPLLEVLEKQPKRAPKDQQALLDVLDTYGGVPMLGDVFRQLEGPLHGQRGSLP